MTDFTATDSASAGASTPPGADEASLPPPEAAPPPMPAKAANVTPSLDVKGLTYAFKTHLAVNNLSFSVTPQAIHGFVGPNGAGKTTTLKVIGTLLKPRSGSVRVFGHDVVTEPHLVRRRLGFMPDHFSMYRQMTVFEYLDFFAAAYGMPPAERNAVIKDVLELTDMGGRQNDLIRGLSRGMQQRVSLARVLVHDPDLLLLDEPASGLDPRARIDLMDILRELSRMGKTIFISSHILSELAMLCNSVTIIDRGKLAYSGSMRGLLVQAEGDEMTYTLTALLPEGEQDASQKLIDAVSAVEGVLSVKHDQSALAENDAEGRSAGLTQGERFQVAFNKTVATRGAILSAALAAGADVEAFQEDVKHLNQAFMDLTEPGVRS